MLELGWQADDVNHLMDMKNLFFSLHVGLFVLELGGKAFIVFNCTVGWLGDFSGNF